jgi:hypothetical protein
MSPTPAARKPWYDILASLTPLIIGIAVTAVGAVATQVYNFRQLQMNQLATLEKFSKQLSSKSALEREFAYAAFSALGYQELALRLAQVRQDEAARGVVEEALDHGSESVRAAAEIAQRALPPVSARVFLHIGDENSRPLASRISQQLAARGMSPQGIENVAGKAGLPSRNEVRYFNAPDRDAAERAAEVLRDQGLADARVRRVEGLRAPMGNLEVWLAGTGVQTP